MKHFVTAGILVVIVLMSITDGYTQYRQNLSGDSNGYKWNRASLGEKAEYVKSRAIGHPSGIFSDYNYWLRNIDLFYDTSDPEMLTATIDEVWGLTLQAHYINKRARQKFGN